MTAREAQQRMFGIEGHDQEWTSEQFVAWLLRFDDVRQTGVVVAEEAHRAFMLAEGHYSRVTNRVAVLNPQMISTVAFVQGVTLAAAAYGREPFGKEI